MWEPLLRLLLEVVERGSKEGLVRRLWIGAGGRFCASWRVGRVVCLLSLYPGMVLVVRTLLRGWGIVCLFGMWVWMLEVADSKLELESGVAGVGLGKIRFGISVVLAPFT